MLKHTKRQRHVIQRTRHEEQSFGRVGSRTVSVELDADGRDEDSNRF